jgi:hypothetical protein
MHALNLSQANFIINRVKNLLPKKVIIFFGDLKKSFFIFTKTLYYALFHPHILYCLPDPEAHRMRIRIRIRIQNTDF